MFMITSLNEELYREYGRRMLEGWISFSKDVKLILVFEGQIPKELKNLNDKSILVEKLKDSKLDQFQQYFGKLYEANGLRLTDKLLPGGQLHKEFRHDYRYDLVRFSFKIFSIFVALKSIPKGSHFGWIDADLKCLAQFSSEDLMNFMPHSEQIMSYLGRTQFPTPDEPYSECGFLGFNPNHQKTLPFLERMRNLYISGEAFRFKQWHDSWLWDEVRKEFEDEGCKFRNLSGKFKNTQHPFINCGLGQFFDHLKGPERKRIGRSFDHDFVRE